MYFPRSCLFFPSFDFLFFCLFATSICHPSWRKHMRKRNKRARRSAHTGALLGVVSDHVPNAFVEGRSRAKVCTRAGPKSGATKAVATGEGQLGRDGARVCTTPADAPRLGAPGIPLRARTPKRRGRRVIPPGVQSAATFSFHRPATSAALAHHSCENIYALLLKPRSAQLQLPRNGVAAVAAKQSAVQGARAGRALARWSRPAVLQHRVRHRAARSAPHCHPRWRVRTRSCRSP